MRRDLEMWNKDLVVGQIKEKQVKEGIMNVHQHQDIIRDYRVPRKNQFY